MRHKGIRIVKSGCVETSLLGCTSGVNAAHRLCRGLGAAYSFFDLELAPEFESVLLDSAVMATARALAFLVFFGQLSAKWPVPAQNMQRLLSSRHLHLSAVSFPSLPSLLVKSGLELEKDWLLVILDEPELVELEELLVLDFS